MDDRRSEPRYAYVTDPEAETFFRALLALIHAFTGVVGRDEEAYGYEGSEYLADISGLLREALGD